MQYSYAKSTVLLDSEACTIIFKLMHALSRSGFQVPAATIPYSLGSVSLATRIAVIISDVLVLLVTWSKTAQLYHESRHLGIKAPLAILLFRDGEREFIIAYPSTSSASFSGTVYFV